MEVSVSYWSPTFPNLPLLLACSVDDDHLPPISISHDQDQLGNIQHISHNLYESISELVEPYLA